jgi:hypothetical protein
VVSCFEHYLQHDGISVFRSDFERNLIAKLGDPAFLNDISPLLPSGEACNTTLAGVLIQKRLVAKLRGEPWKGSGKKNAKGG